VVWNELRPQLVVRADWGSARAAAKLARKKAAEPLAFLTFTPPSSEQVVDAVGGAMADVLKTVGQQRWLAPDRDQPYFAARLALKCAAARRPGRITDLANISSPEAHRMACEVPCSNQIFRGAPDSLVYI